MVDKREIYLDHNATTRVLPSAAKAAFSVMEDLYGNPSSSHIAGLQARRILDSARDVARQVLGASNGRIIFTSGATEAIQTGIFSALYQSKQKLTREESLDRGVLLYGATEHKAVPLALRHWNDVLDLNCEILEVPVDTRGQLDHSFLREHLERTHILCTMAVNNETGVIQDLESIQEIIRDSSKCVAWMVDCVQAVGKIDLNLSNTLIDYAPISGHKLYAPKGIGILYVREGAPFTPMLAGGGQEGGSRGGTENLPGVAAIADVLRSVQDRKASALADSSTLLSFRNRFRSSLERAFPGIIFNTPFEYSVPTTINFSVSGVTSKELLDLFDAAGIRVSSGSACGSAIQGSYVLEAMMLPRWQSDGAIRLSFGPATTEAEVTEACMRIEEAGTALGDSCLTEIPGEPGVDTKFGKGGLLQLKTGSMCTWILSDATRGRCIIVDPFAEMLQRIETIVRCQNLKVLAVLDTHLHVDHDSPRQLLVEELGQNMLDPQQSTDQLGWPTEADGELVLEDGTPAAFLQLSDSMVVARTDFPGHTRDGLLYLAGSVNDQKLAAEDVRFAFTGDNLLIGGIGRTDFSSSAGKEMLTSLRKLPRVIADCSVVCPTHDYTMGFVTTLGSERKHNDLLARILDPILEMSVDEFLAAKRELDSEIDDESNCELVCGHVQAYSATSESIDVEPEELTEFFHQNRDSLIIDVREPHEFYFAQDWSSLGLNAPPENVPLTRIGEFLSRLLTDSQLSERRIVFVCRSGNRSAKAAQVVRRLGISTACHIRGGIALGISPSREVIEAEELEYTI